MANYTVQIGGQETNHGSALAAHNAFERAKRSGLPCLISSESGDVLDCANGLTGRCSESALESYQAERDAQSDAAEEEYLRSHATP